MFVGAASAVLWRLQDAVDDAGRRRVPRDLRATPTPSPLPRPGMRCANTSPAASRKSARSWTRPRRKCWRSARPPTHWPEIWSTNSLERANRNLPLRGGRHTVRRRDPRQHARRVAIRRAPLRVRGVHRHLGKCPTFVTGRAACPGLVVDRRVLVGAKDGWCVDGDRAAEGLRSYG